LLHSGDHGTLAIVLLQEGILALGDRLIEGRPGRLGPEFKEDRVLNRVVNGLRVELEPARCRHAEWLAECGVEGRQVELGDRLAQQMNVRLRPDDAIDLKTKVNGLQRPDLEVDRFACGHERPRRAETRG
jgi:hypothetical protein